MITFLIAAFSSETLHLNTLRKILFSIHLSIYELISLFHPPSQSVVDAIKLETKIIWIESPTNPTLKITDIKAVADAVRAVRDDM